MLSSYGFKTAGEAADALKGFLLVHRWVVNVLAFVKDWVFVSSVECVTTAVRVPLPEATRSPLPLLKLIGRCFVHMKEFIRRH